MSMLNMLLGASGKATISGIWSGDSFAACYGDYAGIDTSGNQYRFYKHRCEDNGCGDEAGAWGSVSQYGEFSNGSTLGSPATGYYTEGIDVSGNLMRTVRYSGYSSTWVTYTASAKAFSGSSTGWNPAVGTPKYYLNTSGGLIRFDAYTLGTYYGSYISLT